MPIVVVMIGVRSTDTSLSRVSTYLLEYLHAETDATWIVGPTRVGFGFPILDHHGEATGYLSLTSAGDASRYQEIGIAVATALAAIGAAEANRPASAATSVLIPTIEDNPSSGRLIAYFQPIVALRTGDIVAIEALARWQTPDGVLAPSTFIDSFNNGHLMLGLFDRMLEAALQFLADHRHRMPDLSASVNLELAAIPESGLGELVSSRLGEFGIDADSLTIELNERLAYEHTAGTVSQLHKLADMGVKLVVDDVSTTFDAIRRMPGVPIAGAKLDRRHVNQLTAGDHEMGVVRGVLERAAAAGIEVIAEGIETQAQCDQLVRFGCNFGQGYLFAVAQPASSLAAVLEATLATSW
jgi:EAL domain-containing protein (putative c-di-GMP-specific phosphodiesterase class I)